MPRSLVIVLGIVLWTAFIAVFALHVAAHDPIAPIVAILIVATAVSMWHVGRRIVRVS
jgi:hypothetical protein